MNTTQGAVKRTYEDYCATADDKRYELLNGDLMMVPAPNRKHQWVLGRLHIELDRFTQEHGLGEVYVAPFDVVLSDTDVVQPDLLFISRAREHTINDENVRGAPDLVIEILSPSTATATWGTSTTSTADTACSSTGWSTRWPRPSPSIGNGTGGSSSPTPSAAGTPSGRRCLRGCSSSSTISLRAEHSRRTEAPRDRKKTGAPRALEAVYRRFWSIDQNRPPSRL